MGQIVVETAQACLPKRALVGLATQVGLWKGNGFFCTRVGCFVRKMCLGCIASLQKFTPVVAFFVVVAKVCLLACKSKHPCFFQAGVLFSTLFLAKFALSFCWMACRQVGQWQGATVRCRAIPQVASWFASVLALAKWHHVVRNLQFCVRFPQCFEACRRYLAIGLHALGQCH